MMMVLQKMNDLPDSLKPVVKGYGSLTALPIIETQAETCQLIYLLTLFQLQMDKFFLNQIF